MKTTLAAAAFTVGALAFPRDILSATSENTCIIAGSTERTCATVAYASAGGLDSRAGTAGYGTPLDPFETRVLTCDFGEALDRFRTDEPHGCIIIIR